MKKRMVLGVAIILSVMGVSQAGLDWDIVEDTTIDGGSYGTVTVDFLNPTGSSAVSIGGSDIEIVRSYESSVVNVGAGTSIGNMWATDVSTVDIYGGTINSVTSAGASRVDVHYLSPYNGSFVYAGISLTGTVNIYGYGFEWTHVGGSSDLSGYWMNGESITFHFRNAEQQGLDGVNIIPEPASILFLGLGFVTVRKRIES